MTGTGKAAMQVCLPVPDGAAPTGFARPLAALLRGWRADRGAIGFDTRRLRAWRRLPVLWLRADHARLAASPAYRLHVASEGAGDPLFALSYRYDLAKGLHARGRLATAAFHYCAQDRILGPASHAALAGSQMKNKLAPTNSC